MARFPALQARDVIRALPALGLEIVRQRGSQARLRHPDARVVTMPVHRGQDVGRGLVRKIWGTRKSLPQSFWKRWINNLIANSQNGWSNLT